MHKTSEYHQMQQNPPNPQYQSCQHFCQNRTSAILNVFCCEVYYKTDTVKVKRVVQISEGKWVYSHLKEKETYSVKFEPSVQNVIQCSWNKSQKGVKEYELKDLEKDSEKTIVDSKVRLLEFQIWIFFSKEFSLVCQVFSVQEDHINRADGNT